MGVFNIGLTNRTLLLWSQLFINNKGPVVQSIISLTTSLIHQLVKYMLTTLSNTPLLCICNIYALTFNETFTSVDVNFEKPVVS